MLRPPEEWFKRDEPYLRDFLPEPLRGIALAKIQALRERRALGDVAGRVRNTHLSSLYILTGLLRAIQDGRLLKGMNCGPRDHKTRYYGHAIAMKNPTLAGFPNTIFRAETLEKALLEEFAKTLKGMPNLRDELRLAVEAVINSRKPASPATLKDLQRQLDKVATKIKITYSVISPETEAEAKVSLADLGRQKREIEAKIRELKEHDKVPILDVDAVVESLVRRLSDLGNQVESLPTYPLRQVLAAFTVAMDADMLTREVTMTVRVPKNAIIDSKTPIGDLCLETNPQLPTVSQAQMANSPILAVIRCEYERVSQKQCYRCRRIRMAA